MYAYPNSKRMQKDVAVKLLTEVIHIQAILVKLVPVG